MTSIMLRRTLAHVRQLAHDVQGDESDHDLLRAFVRSRDEASFAELVRRYASLVFGVARRVVGDHHAAEDVLQATFLLLARKAHRVRWRSHIGPWLHAAAFRIANETRRKQSRQAGSQDIETATQIDSSCESPDKPLLWNEVRIAIDEELVGLPTRLAPPLVMCYLQGMTRDEAARKLGWTLATLKRRLERGRRMLRDRLDRRGISLAAGISLLAAHEGAVSAQSIRKIASLASQLTIESSAGIARRIAVVALVAMMGLCGWFATTRPDVLGQPPANPAKPGEKPRTDVLGDPLPEGAVARLGSVRMNPGSTIAGFDFSPDGKKLAIWSGMWSLHGHDRLVISDTADGRDLRSVHLPPCALIGLRWLADGRGLALVKRNQRDWYLWEFTDENADLPGIEKAVLNSILTGDIRCVAFSPDGRLMATGRISHDGKSQPIDLWEVKTNRPVTELKARELGRQDGHCTHVSFSADGRVLFAITHVSEPLRPGQAGPGGPIPTLGGGRSKNDQVVAYDIETGKRVSAFDIPATSSLSLVLSRDGKTLFVGGADGHIRGFDWAAGKLTTSIAAHPNEPQTLGVFRGVLALALSPSGKTLYSSSGNRGYSAWDLTTSPPKQTDFSQLDGVSQILPLPDGKRLAIAQLFTTGPIHVVDARTGDNLHTRLASRAHFIGMSIQPDGTIKTVGLDRIMRWWDPQNGSETRQAPIVLPSRVGPPALADDGRGVFCRDGRDVVYVDLESGRKTTAATNENVILGNSGRTVFLGGDKQQVIQWDASRSEIRQEFNPPMPKGANTIFVRRVAMSPDERHVVVVLTGALQTQGIGYLGGAQICFFDSKNGELRRRWQTPEAQFTCLAFSPDSRFLLVGGFPMGNNRVDANVEDVLPISAASGLVLFDVPTGEPIRAFERASMGENNRFSTTELSFSSDGRLVAAGHDGGAVHIYELATGDVCRVFRGHRNRVKQLAFSADGRRLVSLSDDLTGLIWDCSYSALARPPGSDVARTQLWADLAKPEWLLAGPAMASLASRPDDLIALAEELKPANEPDVDAEAIKKLVDDLDNTLFAVRDRASGALSRLGREALPVLQEHLGKALTAERQKRLQQAIRYVSRSPVPSDRLRETRLLALLEQQGTSAARKELERLASGHADSGRTQDAKTALRRVKAQ